MKLPTPVRLNPAAALGGVTLALVFAQRLDRSPLARDLMAEAVADLREEAVRLAREAARPGRAG